jgi:hypothetical protein
MIWHEGALKIIDKLLDLLKIAEERRRRTFKELIDPLFIEMTEVHKNYLATFDDVLEQLRERPQPVEVMRNLIVKKKGEMEHVRVKVTSLTQAFGQQHGKVISEEAKQFFAAVLDYFDAASGRAPGYRGRLTDLLTFMDEKYFETEQLGKYKAFAMVYKYRTESGQLVGDDFGYKLYEITQAVRERWNTLTLAYAQAKVELMK